MNPRWKPCRNNRMSMEQKCLVCCIRGVNNGSVRLHGQRRWGTDKWKMEWDLNMVSTRGDMVLPEFGKAFKGENIIL